MLAGAVGVLLGLWRAPTPKPVGQLHPWFGQAEERLVLVASLRPSAAAQKLVLVGPSHPAGPR
eukprot:15461071-Alexandrium_andersonii.AAC.1